MITEFIRLQVRKGVRSVSLGRNIVAGIFLALIVFVLLVNLLVVAFALEALIEDIFEIENAPAFLNTVLLYYFLFEMLLRFFVQKLPVIEMESFLHLPIPRTRIVHFLLGRSLLSPLTLVVVICFTPFALTAVADLHGASGAAGWLSTLFLTSLVLHWGMLWYKQRYGDHPGGIFLLVLIPFVLMGGHYSGILDAGSMAAPWFDWSAISPLPALITAVAGALAYWNTFRYYRNHAYLEELGGSGNITYVNRSIDFFNRFGLAGEMADLEWKLILRHKKSRAYLWIAFLFLFYGLLFYNDPTFTAEEGFSYFYIFLGIFISGSFLMQYGQLFLSWNSASFDFYLSRKDGLRSLVKGKYLLFLFVSMLCFLLSTPYVYFGWDILLIHFVSFLFNMGVSIHLIVYISLWNPKPMDLGKGAMFNYEGIGAAQFLMAIPMILLPYVIFLPFALLAGDYIGLAVLGGTGLAGMFFHEQLSELSVRKLYRNRHNISLSFRQEL